MTILARQHNDSILISQIISVEESSDSSGILTTPPKKQQNPKKLLRQSSSTTPVPEEKKRARFCDDACHQYLEAAAPAKGTLKKSEKELIWYTEFDMHQFAMDFGLAGKLLEKDDRSRARVSTQTLQLAYRGSLRSSAAKDKNRNSSPSAAMTKRQATEDERLRNLYLKDPDMVGMEEILLPQLRTDSLRRQKNLQGAIGRIARNKKMNADDKATSICLASQKISQPSRLFANKIASAQQGTTGEEEYDVLVAL